MFAATAKVVHRTHWCAWRGRWVLLDVYGVAPAVVDPANSDRRNSPRRLLLSRLPGRRESMRATLMLMRNTTAARPLLLLLPWRATATKYHTVVPSLASASPTPPVPKTTACGFGGATGAPSAGSCLVILWALRWEWRNGCCFLVPCG